jgi:hypothetical protein
MTFFYNGVFLANPPLLPSLTFPIPFAWAHRPFAWAHRPFAWTNRPLYLLGDPFSYDCGAIIRPLSSLVSYQLPFPCCLTYPEDTP